MKKKPVISLPIVCSTRDVARALGMKVDTVREMLDKEELRGWKTQGGRWRVERESVMSWLQLNHLENVVDGSAAVAKSVLTDATHEASSGEIVIRPKRFPQRVLLIEDSAHFQQLVQLLMGNDFPQVDLHVADDGVVGLLMAGRLDPDVLIVDVLLPDIDGATLVDRLRSQPQFQSNQFIVITSLDEESRAPHARALEGVSVIHKASLMRELPMVLNRTLASSAAC
jgi:excisionase family DNA binding protein